MRPNNRCKDRTNSPSALVYRKKYNDKQYTIGVSVSGIIYTSLLMKQYIFVSVKFPFKNKYSLSQKKHFSSHQGHDDCGLLN